MSKRQPWTSLLNFYKNCWRLLFFIEHFRALKNACLYIVWWTSLWRTEEWINQEVLFLIFMDSSTGAFIWKVWRCQRQEVIETYILMWTIFTIQQRLSFLMKIDPFFPLFVHFNGFSSVLLRGQLIYLPCWDYHKHYWALIFDENSNVIDFILMRKKRSFCRRLRRWVREALKMFTNNDEII